MDRRTFLNWLWLGIIVSSSPKAVAATLENFKNSENLKPKSNSSDPLVFYVSLNGNDAWSGKQPAPNTESTDGPFATLVRARDAIRSLKGQQGGMLKQSVKVFLREGTYFLDTPVVFTPEDSGTAEYPITYAAYQSEKPMISGGRSITGWKEETVNGKNLWTVEIPDVSQGKWFFHQLWVQGKRRMRSRYPNQGYLQVAQSPDVTEQTQWHEGQRRFGFHTGDLQEWSNVAEDAELVIMTRWAESRLPITKIDETQNLIFLAKPTQWRTDVGDLYYIENLLETLDSTGEWHLSRKSGKLYYFPTPEESINQTEIIAPLISQLLILEGNLEQKEFIEYLHFENLTFAHTEWYYSSDTKFNSFAQAAVGVPGAIYGTGVTECEWKNCQISQIGTYAIELSRGCHNNLINGCKMVDLGGGGIKIGEAIYIGPATEQQIIQPSGSETYNNQIIDNQINNGGLIFHSSVGIWIGQSYNNLIRRNHIYNFYYTAISIGWTWGYGQSIAKENIVEWNHIHHIGFYNDQSPAILDDLGGIYTLGTQPGTKIQYNSIHDIGGYSYGGWGIYLDAGSSEILVEKNIVYKNSQACFHQHYGKNNIVRNNIFAYGNKGQIQRTKKEDHLSFTFEFNIIVWKQGNLLLGNWDDLNFLWQRNVYWYTGEGEIRFASFSWETWKLRTGDTNSIIANPLFVDIAHNNFQLKPESPAFLVGFQNLPAELFETQTYHSESE